MAENWSPRAVKRRLDDLQRRLGITRAGQMALLAAVGLWIAARVVAGTAMYLFAYGAALLVIVSYAIAPRRLRLTGEREGLFPRAQEGDRLDVRVRLTATRTVSTFILEERVPERLGNPVRVPIAKLSSGAAVEHRYGLRCGRRGVYQVGPLVAIAGDPLGLSQRETVVAEPFELLVHPRVELVNDRPLTRQFEDPPVRPPVSKPWPSGLEFYGMREYTPGDDLRRIVWRASARTGTIMVREAEQGITDKIMMVLNTDRAAHSRDGEGYSESFEAGIRVAASIGVGHLREGYEVRCETSGGPLTRPLRGPASQMMLLDGLARLEHSRDSLSNALMRLLIRPARDAHHVIITPRLHATEATQLRMLVNRGVSVLVVALVWDEADAETIGTAAGLGCAVAGVHPGQDLATALYGALGAGAGSR
ncbi:MAG TPA: DUF58 domain-containing protein [Acidimicrobiales bacterium]|nr:DUF58 domain-containing protein [Acidimicrobiales bacterium]